MDGNGIGWAGRVMQWLQLGMCLVIVNLLFVAGTLAGLVLFGLFPAAVAASGVLAGVRSGTGRDHVVGDFVAAYRSEFLHANAVGGVFWVAGTALALSLVSFQGLLGGTGLLSGTGPAPASPFAGAMLLLVLAGALWTVSAAAVAVAACARYRDSVFRTVRYAFVLPLVSPLMSLTLIVSLGAIAVIFTRFEVLVPLVGASLPLLVAGWCVDHRLDSVSARMA